MKFRHLLLATTASAMLFAGSAYAADMFPVGKDARFTKSERGQFVYQAPKAS